MADSAQVIRDAYEAFDRGDVPAILGVLGEEVTWDVPEAVPHGGSFRGPDGVGAFFQGIGSHWSEFKTEIVDLVADGDLVVGVGRADGTRSDGTKTGYGFSHVFNVEDGTIVRFREYVDPDAELR